MRTNKTDRSDAKGLAELIRMGQSMLRVDWMTGTLRELWNLSGESRFGIPSAALRRIFRPLHVLIG
jgi:hypothetical protein